MEKPDINPLCGKERDALEKCSDTNSRCVEEVRRNGDYYEEWGTNEKKYI